ncbi:hypothetical protein STENM327S_08132 [Streptomyces tendae]
MLTWRLCAACSAGVNLPHQASRASASRCTSASCSSSVNPFHQASRPAFSRCTSAARSADGIAPLRALSPLASFCAPSEDSGGGGVLTSNSLNQYSTTRIAGHHAHPHNGKPAKPVHPHPTIPYRAANGDHTVAERREKIRQFANGIDAAGRRVHRAFLASVRVLGEGVDITGERGVEAGRFADTRGSQVEIVQNIGRALRLNRDGSTKVARIIVPVFLEPGEAPDRHGGQRQTPPPHGRRSYQGLRSHDERLVEQLVCALTSRKRKVHVRRARRRRARRQRRLRTPRRTSPLVRSPFRRRRSAFFAASRISALRPARSRSSSSRRTAGIT